MNKLETIETLMCKDKREQKVSQKLKNQNTNSTKSKKMIGKQEVAQVMAMCGD